MADEYDPFNLRKHPGYYAELVQERDPTQDVAASYVKNHQYDGGILGQLERNPHGLGDSPLPFDPSGAELRSTSEGGSAFTERPKDHLQPVAELISPTLGAFGAGQMAGTAYKEAGEGDYQDAGMSLAPLLAGMVVPGAPKGARGPKVLSREIDARGFYSPSLEAVKGLGQESGTVQQFRSMLLKAGGKPKELEAVGFDRAFPDPNAKVSRQEIEQYLRDNRVQLGAENKGHPGPPDIDDAIARATADGDTEAVKLLQRVKHKTNGVITDRYGIVNELNGARQPSPGYPLREGDAGEFMKFEAVDRSKDYLEPFVGANPQFESYSTPGGIPGSYREVVTTLPVAKSEPVFDPSKVQIKRNRQSATQGTYEILYDGKKLAGPYGDDGTPQTNYMRPDADIIETARGVFERGDMRNKFPAVQDNYTSSHWPGMVNPGPHRRTQKFENEDGTITQLEDEFQNDWTKAMDVQGVRDPEAASRLNAELMAVSTRKSEIERALGQYATNNLGIKHNGLHDNPFGDSAVRDALVHAERAGDQKLAGMMEEWRGLYDQSRDLSNKYHAVSKGVPPIPYGWDKTSNWVDYLGKQALIDAARDPKVSRVAFTPGEQQVQRYPYLSKRVDGIRYNPTGHQLVYKPHGRDGWSLYEKPGGGGATIKPEELAGLVGDDVAKELLTGTGRARTEKLGDIDVNEVGGLDNYEIGPARGMRKFYGDWADPASASEPVYNPGIVTRRMKELVKGLDPDAARVEPHGIRQGNAEVANELWTIARDAQPGLRQEQASQLVGRIEKIIFQEGPEALHTYDPPAGFERAWKAAVAKVDEAAKQDKFSVKHPSVPMTKAMREKILKEGLPLFNVAALSALVQRILGQGQPDTEGEDGGGF
jgi:hypothetical protein